MARSSRYEGDQQGAPMSQPIESAGLVVDQSSGIAIVDVQCPMCGTKSAQSLLTDLADIEDRVPGRYSIGRCPGCGLVYLSRRPTADSLSRCYPPKYHVHDPVRRRLIPSLLYGFRLKSRCDRLLRSVGERCGALLEVGCGDGSFLELLSRRMPAACTLSGIDLMATVRTDSRVTIVRGEFEKVEWASKYDAIVMYGVLEHLADPLSALQRMSRLLEPGGLLVGDVPNWDSLWRKLFPRHWAGLQVPRHQTLFSPRSLRDMLNAAGYDTVGIRYVYDPGDLSVSLCNWIADKLRLRTPPRQVWFYFPAAMLCAPVVGLVNLLSGDSGNMEFVARRR